MEDDLAETITQIDQSIESLYEQRTAALQKLFGDQFDWSGGMYDFLDQRVLPDKETREALAQVRALPATDHQVLREDDRYVWFAKVRVYSEEWRVALFCYRKV